MLLLLTCQDEVGVTCVTEFSHDQASLELLVIVWLCAMGMDIIHKIVLNHEMARRIHSSALREWLDIWTVLDVTSIILCLSVIRCCPCRAPLSHASALVHLRSSCPSSLCSTLRGFQPMRTRPHSSGSGLGFARS